MEKLSGSGPAGVRSYSDFMRSLAAKYNNNEYFSPQASGGSPPPTTVAPNPVKPDPSSPLFPFLTGFPPGLNSIQAGFSLQAAAVGFPGFSPFLQQQLQAGAGGSIGQGRERPLVAPPPVTGGQKRVRVVEDPLDLTEKKVKLEQDQHENMSTGTVTPTGSESPRGDERPASPGPSRPSSVPSDPNILSWSVKQVAEFVGDIEICREYQQVFLDNKLDGGCLPLLTESHLTAGLGMKLGPALKFLTALRRALGPEFAAPRGGCHHCAHCHDQQLDIQERSAGDLQEN